MGARSVPHPAPGPGAAPGSIAAARPGPLAGLDDLEAVARTEVDAIGALEDVADPASRKHEAMGRHDQDPQHDVVVADERDFDREAHAERVDGPRPFEQEGVVGIERRTTEQSTNPFAPRIGHDCSKDKTAGAPQADLSHGSTVARPGDTASGYTW